MRSGAFDAALPIDRVRGQPCPSPLREGDICVARRDMGTRHEGRSLLVQPRLCVNFPPESLRMFATTLVDIPCSPTTSLAVVGALLCSSGPVCVADCLGPTVSQRQPDGYACRSYLFLPCVVGGRNPRSRARRTSCSSMIHIRYTKLAMSSTAAARRCFCRISLWCSFARQPNSTTRGTLSRSSARQ
jgi:hypothetical protein